MASTSKEKKKAREYYKTHKKYREEKIKDSIDEQKKNPEEHAKYQRKYYHKNQDYRSYKIKYAKDYRKREKVKSKARKDRKAYR